MIKPTRVEYVIDGSHGVVFETSDPSAGVYINSDGNQVILTTKHAEVLWEILGQQLGKVSNLVLPGHGPGVRRDHVVG